jgi:hypothetical protein
MSVKTLARKGMPDTVDQLGADENPFSTNKVTGHSLNFPILQTCAPTSVCTETCYFAKGPSTWRASLEKQGRLQNLLDADPLELARRVVVHAKRMRLTFIRWNGGGDLSRNAAECIDAVAVAVPEVPLWIVSRLPGLAAGIVPRDNVFLHFSVDRSSRSRLDLFRRRVPEALRWFWSYQCAPGEYPPDWAQAAAVIFRDKYHLVGDRLDGDCPLNGAESIVRVCESCRRCFDGRAVATRVASETNTNRP